MDKIEESHYARQLEVFIKLFIIQHIRKMDLKLEREK